jgi:hypothetical protein
MTLGWVYGFGKGRAAAWLSGEVRARSQGGGLFGRHRAVVRAVAAAARWKIRLEIAAGGKERRDQREAEEEDERDCENSPHAASLTDRLRGDCHRTVIVVGAVWCTVSDASRLRTRFGTRYPRLFDGVRRKGLDW